MLLINRFILFALLISLVFTLKAQEIYDPDPYAILTGVPGSYYNIGVQGVHVGDVNGDGFSDMITYANYKTTPGAPNTMSYVAFFGDPTGQVSSTVGATFVNPIGTGTTNGFATDSKVGDVNGDGIDDLIVGARMEAYISTTNDTLPNSGAVYIYFGTNGLSGERQPDVRLEHPDPIKPNNYVDWPATKPNLFFGWAVGAGDFNNDGTGDIVISEHGGHPWIITDPANAIDTVHSIPDTVINWSFQFVYLGPISQTSTPDYTLRTYFHNSNGGSYKIPTGDWNGDGITDIAITAYGANNVNILGAATTAEDTADFERKELYGKVLFYYGNSDISSWENQPDYIMSKVDTTRGELSQGTELLGYAQGLAGRLSSGDFDGDGIDDFLTTGAWSFHSLAFTYGYEVGLPLKWIFLGGSNFGEGPVGGIGKSVEINTVNSNRMTYGNPAGDINGDGKDDWLFSGFTDSIGSDPLGQRINGQYYLYLGGNYADDNFKLLRPNDPRFNSAYGIQPASELWDMDGDDITEWAIAASGWGDSAQGKIYIYKGDVTLTSVKPEYIGIANNYSLSQNYPNPFNPATTIKFSVPHSEFVELKIYDILGREIITLINKEYQSGEYSIILDMKSLGLNLSSGTYFYRLKAGDFTQTKKMIFLK